MLDGEKLFWSLNNVPRILYARTPYVLYVQRSGPGSRVKGPGSQGLQYRFLKQQKAG